MPLVLPLTYERALYHKTVHPLACLINALQYQLNENLQRPAAAAFPANYVDGSKRCSAEAVFDGDAA